MGIKRTSDTSERNIMKRYYSCYNNGVNAIVSEEVLRDLEKRQEIYKVFWSHSAYFQSAEFNSARRDGLRGLGVPIFTFVSPERFKTAPWCTGDNDLRDAVLKQIQKNGGDVYIKSFHVPFSNGIECGLSGPESMVAELAHVTTEQQFRETFGVSIEECLKNNK